MNQPDSTDALLERVAAGDRASRGALLTLHAERLRRMIGLRLDARLRRRLDPEDVLQEALVEADQRLSEYLDHPTMPFFIWLRFLVAQKLIQLQRHHLGTLKRAAGREIALVHGTMPEASSIALAEHLLGRETRASETILRSERKARLENALNEMDMIDREVLVLRHFEQLTNVECAEVLGLTESASTKRYLRALKRLRGLLTAPDSTPSEFWR